MFKTLLKYLRKLLVKEGVALVDAIADKFKQQIEQLDKAVSHIDEEISSHETTKFELREQIAQLTDTQAVLGTKAQQAVKLRDNLKSLVG